MHLSFDQVIQLLGIYSGGKSWWPDMEWFQAILLSAKSKLQKSIYGTVPFSKKLREK